MATGLVALWLFARGQAAISNRWVLIVATMPGALAGALALWALSDGLAVAVLALFLVTTGIRLLYSGPAPDVSCRPASALADTQIGAVAGFFSALTGTGGPMVLVPLLVWRGAPLMTAVAVGQLVQFPISGVGTLGNYANGDVDFAMATLIGLVLMPGVVFGYRTVERIPIALVTRVVAVVLVAAGC